jgi:CO/xanthine dehydrogenase FAD-binding subunit
MLEMEETTCRTARVAAGSVAPIPMRVFRVEELLEGREVGETLVEECSELLRAEISPISDVRGSDKYRSYVASAVLKRQIEMAVEDRRTFGA